MRASQPDEAAAGHTDDRQSRQTHYNRTPRDASFRRNYWLSR
jgi:hypothetical protein